MPQSVPNRPNPFQTPSQLDFPHLERDLNAERQVCKLVPTLLPKEVKHADSSCHSDALDCKVCSAVFQACGGTRAGIDSGGATCARQTDGDRGLAGQGAQPGAALSEVSSGAQSGAVVESGNSAHTI